MPAARSRTGPLVRAGLTISRGKLVASDGAEYTPVRGPDGRFREILDVADALAPRYDGLYVVDLDGRRKGEPQLDYIQELSRDVDLWLDAGVQVADEAIDGLVAGARRVVLSTVSLASVRELRRSWKMSTEIVVEIAVAANGSVVALEGDWAGAKPSDVASAIRALGPQTLAYGPRGHPPDWDVVAALSAGGPTWVAGAFNLSDLPSLATAKAEGGVFHIPRSDLTSLGLASPPEVTGP